MVTPRDNRAVVAGVVVVRENVVVARDILLYPGVADHFVHFQAVTRVDDQKSWKFTKKNLQI